MLCTVGKNEDLQQLAMSSVSIKSLDKYQLILAQCLMLLLSYLLGERHMVSPLHYKPARRRWWFGVNWMPPSKGNHRIKTRGCRWAWDNNSRTYPYLQTSGIADAKDEYRRWLLQRLRLKSNWKTLLTFIRTPQYRAVPYASKADIALCCGNSAKLLIHC